MWKHRILYLLMLCVAFVAYVAADQGAALAFFVFLLILPVILFVIQIMAMQSLFICGEIKRSCRINQTIPLVFRATRKNRIPLGILQVDVSFENLLFAETKTIRLNLQPGEHKTMVFEYPYTTEDCGEIKIHIPYMDCYDLLGLCKWHKKIDIEEELLVYPGEFQPHVDFSKRPEVQNFGELYDPYKKGQDVSEVSGLRDYVNGDAINSIHWKLSGKLDRTIVREFGSPSNYSTLILYDMMKKSRGQTISHARNNAVMALTISLSYSMMEQGFEHNVGRIYQNQFRSEPVNSLGSHEQMAHDLLYMPIQQEEDGTNTVYIFLRGNTRNEYTRVIYITPAYDETSLKQIANTADLTVIHVVEGKELEYMVQKGFAVIPINADTYQDTIRNIVL